MRIGTQKGVKSSSVNLGKGAPLSTMIKLGVKVRPIGKGRDLTPRRNCRKGTTTSPRGGKLKDLYEKGPIGTKDRYIQIGGLASQNGVKGKAQLPNSSAGKAVTNLFLPRKKLPCRKMGRSLAKNLGPYSKKSGNLDEGKWGEEQRREARRDDT